MGKVNIFHSGVYEGWGGRWWWLFYSLQIAKHTTKQERKDKAYVFLDSRQASTFKVNGLICDLQRESQ